MTKYAGLKPLLQNNRQGLKTKYLDFETSDYVSVGNPAIFQNLVNNFSVEFWAYAGTNSSLTRFVTKDQNSGNISWGVTFNPAYNWVALMVSINGTSISQSSGAASYIPLNTWAHICFTKSSTTGARLYINGVLGRTISQNGDLYAGNSPLLFGLGFVGYIEDVRIWNHVRSTDQIKRYRSVRLFGNETGLLGYWPMDKLRLSGTDYYTDDKTSNGNNGLVSGATQV